MFLTLRSVSRCAGPSWAMSCITVFATSARATFDIFPVGGDATPASIQAQSTLFRAALGDPNNGNNPGPLAGGRREINWDGGGSATASPVGTPFMAISEYPRRHVDHARNGLSADAARRHRVDQHQRQPTRRIWHVQPAANLHAAGQQHHGRDVFAARQRRRDSGDGGRLRCRVLATSIRANTTRWSFSTSVGVLLATLNVPPDRVTDGGLSFFGGDGQCGRADRAVRITTGNSAAGPDGSERRSRGRGRDGRLPVLRAGGRSGADERGTYDRWSDGRRILIVPPPELTMPEKSSSHGVGGRGDSETGTSVLRSGLRLGSRTFEFLPANSATLRESYTFSF